MHVINQTHQSGWLLFFPFPPNILPRCCFDESVHFKSAIQMWVHLPTFFFSLWCFVYMITKELLRFIWRFPPFLWKGSSKLLQLFWNRLEGSEKKMYLTVRYVARGARKREGKKSKDITESWLIRGNIHFERSVFCFVFFASLLTQIYTCTLDCSVSLFSTEYIANPYFSMGLTHLFFFFLP